jgi:protein gp37
MAKTNIEWCDEVSNWFTGCRNGCSWCYARRMANRLAHIPGTVYERVSIMTSTSPYSGGRPFEPAVHYDVAVREYNRLLRSRKPARIFLGSMGDISAVAPSEKIMTFGEDGNSLPRGEWWYGERLQQFAANWCATHGSTGKRFYVLTKRPEHLLSRPIVSWPGNAYLGVSITGNDDAWRIERLLERDCRTWIWGKELKLWASVEPLLDPDFDPSCLAGLDWVVVGLQTGPGAPARWTEERKRLEDALLRVVRWCQMVGMRVFVKGKIGTDAQDALLPRQHLD